MRKSGSGLVGDISGPFGIPDGQVDPNDLTAFFGEWLSESDK